MFDFLKGGMLTGAEIEKQIKKGNIGIDPYDPSCINPNSYNLKLHPQLLIYKRDADRANILNQLPQKHNPIVFLKHDIDLICTNNDFGIATTPSNISPKSNNADGNGYYEISKTDDVAHTFTSTTSFREFKEKTDKNLESLNRVTNTIRTNHSNRIHTLEEFPINDSYFLPPLDMKSKNETIEFEIPEEGFVLQPGVLYIGRTVERTLTDKYIPMINGRSSGGRLGISIHICAGFGDVGFDGTWTLEITCVEPVRIYPYSEIAQVCYFSPYGKIKNLYRGRYQKQEDATASRFYKSKEEL